MSAIQKRGVITPNNVDQYWLNENKLPIVFEALQRNVKLNQWIKENNAEVDGALQMYGAILFRNFSVNGVGEFEEAVKARGGNLIDYNYASTPRMLQQGKIYTSTEYPAEKIIAQHNEMSYSRVFPKSIWFYCATPSKTGGETPLADSRKVYFDIDDEIKKFLESNELLYVRNFHPNVDLDWRSVFKTSDIHKVSKLCQEMGIIFHWYSGDHLQTREISQVILETADGISWFNQAHLFHLTNLEPAVAEHLVKVYGEAFVPRNVYRGDGTQIPPHFLNEVRWAYKKNLALFGWNVNDVLLVDNLRVSHGRNSFTGERKIFVAMTN